AGVPVLDGDEVEEPLPEGDVGNVGRPHLVGLGDLQVPQQVGVDGGDGCLRLVCGPGAMERRSISCMSRWTRLLCTRNPSARNARVICRDPMKGCSK
ncbi:MAG TPA: hypothetical protein VMW80_12410, partial [Candidatus Dormibacteraeota bacterium]|nr:hypothetical protein [Candidatus Dormibacteraeota bacterium]